MMQKDIMTKFQEIRQRHSGCDSRRELSGKRHKMYQCLCCFKLEPSVFAMGVFANTKLSHR